MPVGVYRRVILTSRFAIKIPRLKKFTSGMRCNRSEAEMWNKWRPIFKWEHLCPVCFCDPLGIILIMAKVKQPVTFEEVREVNRTSYDYYPGVDLEYKAENWGIYKNKIVCVDYGIDDQEHLDSKRVYYSEFRK